MRISYSLPLAALLSIPLFTGCTSYSPLPTTGGDGQVSYGDPEAVETLSINFGSTDLKMMYYV